MKSISPYIACLWLLTFCYQNGGHLLLSDINVLCSDQVEIPMEEPVDESEREIEENEVKCLTLNSSSDELINMLYVKYINYKELSRNLVWLEHQTPPPQGLSLT